MNISAEALKELWGTTPQCDLAVALSPACWAWWRDISYGGFDWEATSFHAVDHPHAIEFYTFLIQLKLKS